MTDSEVVLWCKRNNWTEPRHLEIGLWVAFPPGGVIETPIPLQIQKPKNKPLQDIIDVFLLAIATLVLLAIALIMSPCFVQAAMELITQDDYD